MGEPLKPFPEELSALVDELRTFYRILPQLLADGEEDRYVVIKGDAVHGTWDTFRDALGHGRSVFADAPFMAQKVDARMLPLLAPYFGTPDPVVAREEVA
jgi:hypothetical protein